MGSGRQWVTSPSVFPPERFSSLAAVAVDLSSHFSQMLGMTCTALHGELRDSLQKYLGRSAFLMPGSAQGLSWDRLLVELLNNAERWQVWGLPDDPPGNKRWLRGTEQLCQPPDVSLREEDLCNRSPCSQAAVSCPLRWSGGGLYGWVDKTSAVGFSQERQPLLLYASPAKRGCI